MRNTRSRGYEVAKSPAERAFMVVNTLQDMLTAADVRKLSLVSSTMSAVANDPYVWRQFLAQKLHMPGAALRYPVDSKAREEEDQSERPYRQLYRGLQILDGNRAARVVPENRDKEQRRCARRAMSFIDENFPGLNDSIRERHSILSAPPTPHEMLQRENIAVGACTTGITIGFTVFCGSGAIHSATLTQAAAANSFTASHLVRVLGLKATKVILFSSYGLLTLTGLLFSYGFTRLTFEELQTLRRQWRELDRRATACTIQQRLATMRVERDYKRVAKDHPDAILSDVTAGRRANT